MTTDKTIAHIQVLYLSAGIADLREILCMILIKQNIRGGEMT